MVSRDGHLAAAALRFSGPVKKTLPLVGLACAASAALAQPAFAEEAVSVTQGRDQRVVTFDTASPGQLTGSSLITGLESGERVVALDFQPSTGRLLAVTDEDRLVRLDPAGGATTVVAADVDDVEDADALDVNPVVDRLRAIVDGDENLRIDPSNGAVTEDDELAYAEDDRNDGRNPDVTAAAYTDNVAGATATRLFVIDTRRDVLALQSPPNEGVLSTVGALRVNASDDNGFDVSGATGDAYAVFERGNASTLYRVNLETGRATPAGRVGPGGRGAARLVGLAIIPPSEVDVLFNNDPESRLLPTAAGYGGAAQTVSLFEQLAAEAGRPRAGLRSVLRLNAGDNVIPGAELSASLDKQPRVPFYDALALRRIGFDALAIGNHEFDLGPDVFAELVRGFGRDARFVSSNLDVAGEPAVERLVRQGRVVPYVVLERDGQRFGVVGATTPDLAEVSSPEGVSADPDVRARVQAAIDAVQERGANRVFMVTQLQSIGNDTALAQQLRGIDVIVSGGGQETQQDAGDPLVPGDSRSLDFPVRTQNADGDTAFVVTTNGLYKYVGRLVVRFDSRGRVVGEDEERSRAYPVEPALPEDRFTVRRVEDPVRAYLASLARTVIAQAEVALNGGRGSYTAPAGQPPGTPGGTFAPGLRTAETNLGDLFADALLSSGRRLAAAEGDDQPEIAIQNGGGIRGGFDAGPVNRSQTRAAAPFNNFVTVVQDVDAATLKALLENAVSNVYAVDGRFAQVAGFRFTWDIDRPAGSRIVSAELLDGTDLVAGGAPVGGAPLLDVATIDFLGVNGQDGYDAWVPNDEVRYGETYLQALEDFLTTDLGGTIPAARYPEGGAGRITRNGTP